MSDVWYNGNYGFRRRLIVTPPTIETIEEGFPITVIVDDLTWQNLNKIRTDGEDMQVVYLDTDIAATPVQVAIPSKVVYPEDENSLGLAHVVFNAEEPLDKQVIVPDLTPGLVVDGYITFFDHQSQNWLETPNRSEYNSLDNFTLVTKIRRRGTDWTPQSIYTKHKSIHFEINVDGWGGTAMVPRLIWEYDNHTNWAWRYGAPLPDTSDWLYIAVTWRDIGDGNYEIKFWTSLDNVNWMQSGTTWSTAATISPADDSNHPAYLGGGPWSSSWSNADFAYISFRQSTGINGVPGGTEVLTMDRSSFKVADISTDKLITKPSSALLTVHRSATNGALITQSTLDSLFDGLQGENTNYYLYYNNPNLVGHLDLPFTDSDYVIVLTADDYNSSLTFSRPSEHWDSGRSDKINARFALNFYGIYAKLTMKKGPDKGIMELRIDDQDPIYIDTFAPVESEEIVFSTERLEPGFHGIRCRVTGDKNPTANSYTIEFVSFEYSIFVEAIEGPEEINPANPGVSFITGI